jgi:hypothetical protein
MADDKKATLLSRLDTAVALELATIPPYMVALLSMKLSANREAADLIRSVMIEEMLHLALVANVTNAVGGTVRIGPHNIPSYPLKMTFEGHTFADRQFDVNLAAFSRDNIAIFMEIEEPQEPPRARAMVEKKIDIPELTIGEFYASIIALLEELDAEDPGALFKGDPAWQLHDDYYWSSGGKIIPVTDLGSAKAALDIVITQGEGAWPAVRGTKAFNPAAPLKMGHYYRFSEIFYGRHYTVDDDPATPPTGAPLPVDYSAVHPIKTNPTAADYANDPALEALNDAFNARYTMMLRQLEQALTGTPKTLYTAIMNGMHGLTSVAVGMMSAPIAGDPSGRTGCPTFDWRIDPEGSA